MFLIVSALRIYWAGVICARVVWSFFLEAVSTSEKLLEQSHIRQLDFVKGCAVLSVVSLCCASDRKPACRENDGQPCLHKSCSGLSGKCPSTHEVWK